MEPELIKFVRSKDYKLLKKLGRGGFGETVLLLDETISEKFVCKKYAPSTVIDSQIYFANFVKEIKILYQLSHPNIVRVFNYHLYPDKITGYIIMEYVEGRDIEEHSKEFPESIEDLFLQAIDGFSNLESQNILHRDLRPQNILVSENGALKIIDFGFGKKIETPKDFERSVSLNWPYPSPLELVGGKYDFGTEVYFVGRLFEKIVNDNELTNFKFQSIIKKMVSVDPERRIGSFNEVHRSITSSKLETLDFSPDEKSDYRNFTNELISSVGSIAEGAKYVDDIEKVILKLEAIYQSVMLEENIEQAFQVVRCVVDGGFKYHLRNTIEVENLKNFIQLVRRADRAKRNIILRNLHTRLDAVKRFSTASRDLDDEVPF